MSEKMTLEEIKALAAEATPGPWGIMGRTVGVNPENPMAWSGIAMVTGYGDQSDANLHLIAQLPRLLEIAREQAGEMERLRNMTKVLIAGSRVEYSDDGKNWVPGYACIFANENGYTWGNRFYKYARAKVGTKK
jgi:hypothetical protein